MWLSYWGCATPVSPQRRVRGQDFLVHRQPIYVTTTGAIYDGTAVTLFYDVLTVWVDTRIVASMEASALYAEGL